MSSSWPTPGVGHVGEYQVSGHVLPVTGSNAVINLKYLASSITVSADGADAEVTFYDSGSNGVAFTVPTNSTTRFTGKFKKFKVASPGDALVELTNIPSVAYNAPIFTDLFSE
jgi:hypothetical protein